MCCSSDRFSSGHEIDTAERFTSYLAKYLFIQQIMDYVINITDYVN